MDTPELISLCDACLTPIAARGGLLWIDNAEVFRQQAAARGWQARHEAPDGSVSFTGMDLADLPGRVRWRAHHTACDPNPDVGAYSIEVERLSTWADLTHWTAHLMDKEWLDSTDWAALLEGVAKGDGTRLRPVKPSKLHF